MPICVLVLFFSRSLVESDMAVNSRVKHSTMLKLHLQKQICPLLLMGTEKLKTNGI